MRINPSGGSSSAKRAQNKTPSTPRKAPSTAKKATPAAKPPQATGPRRSPSKQNRNGKTSMRADNLKTIQAITKAIKSGAMKSSDVYADVSHTKTKDFSSKSPDGLSKQGRRVIKKNAATKAAVIAKKTKR